MSRRVPFFDTIKTAKKGRSSKKRKRDVFKPEKTNEERLVSTHTPSKTVHVHSSIRFVAPDVPQRPLHRDSVLKSVGRAISSCSRSPKKGLRMLTFVGGCGVGKSSMLKYVISKKFPGTRSTYLKEDDFDEEYVERTFPNSTQIISHKGQRALVIEDLHACPNLFEFICSKNAKNIIENAGFKVIFVTKSDNTCYKLNKRFEHALKGVKRFKWLLSPLKPGQVFEILNSVLKHANSTTLKSCSEECGGDVRQAILDAQMRHMSAGDASSGGVDSFPSSNMFEMTKRILKLPFEKMMRVVDMTASSDRFMQKSYLLESDYTPSFLDASDCDCHTRLNAINEMLMVAMECRRTSLSAGTLATVKFPHSLRASNARTSECVAKLALLGINSERFDFSCFTGVEKSCGALSKFENRDTVFEHAFEAARMLRRSKTFYSR